MSQGQARGERPAVAFSRSGDGPRATALIHGVGTNRSIWSRALPGMEPTRTIVAVDLPGFGESPAPAGGWSIEGVAETIALALASELDPPFDLVGSSLGGAVALALAHRRPELVGRLVLCAPAGFRPAPAPLPHLAGLIVRPWLAVRREAGLRLADHAGGRRAFLAGTVADGSTLDPEAARLVLRASAGSTALPAAFQAAAAANLTRMATEMGDRRIGLIWGTLDRIVPPHTAERVLAARPDSVLELIEGAGHIPHVEKPDQFNQALERVLERLP